VRAHLPLVVFAGEAPLKSGWYNQEIDQAPLITATGAAYHSLHMPERMPVAVRDAFLQTRRERRPVVIGVPFDLQAPALGRTGRICPGPRTSCCRRPSPIPAHPDDVASAAQLLAGAERVVVLAGLGAVEAGRAPLAGPWPARRVGCCPRRFPREGLFHDDPFLHRHLGQLHAEVGIEYLAQADFVIAVGCSLAYHAGGGGQLWPKARMLQIDIDPVAVSQGQEVARHHLRADARLGVEALMAALPTGTGAGEAMRWLRASAIRKPDSHVFEIEPGLLDPRHVVEALEKNLAARLGDGELGRPLFMVFRADASRPQETFLTIREFGAIATASPSPWASRRRVR